MARQQPDREHLIYGRGGGDATPTEWAAIVIDTDTSADSFTIMNVTVDDSLGHNYVMYAMYDHPTLLVSLNIQNCTFRATGPESPIFTTGATNLVADHNLFYITNSSYVISHGDMEYTSTQLTDLGSGNQYGDPKFVRPAWGATGDYHLKPDSPAIDAGRDLNPPTADLENHPRDSCPDMGAYEYGDCVHLSGPWFDRRNRPHLWRRLDGDAIPFSPKRLTRAPTLRECH